MYRSTVFLLLLAALLTACGQSDGPPPQGVPSDEEFAAVYVELRVAAHEAKDQAEFEARRAEILASRGLDAEALARYVGYRGDDVERLVPLWRDIEAELELRLNPQPADSAPPAPAPGERRLPEEAEGERIDLGPPLHRLIPGGARGAGDPAGNPERGPSPEPR